MKGPRVRGDAMIVRFPGGWWAHTSGLNRCAVHRRRRAHSLSGGGRGL